MEENESLLPYTAASFKSQARLLKEEISKLGVVITDEEAQRICFLSRRKYERYDHFYHGESFYRRLLNWLEVNFERKERQTAFEIIRYLKFISEYEMKELASHTFEKARSRILDELHGYSKHNWYNYLESIYDKLEKELAKSIFVACADDIYFDFFRRYAMRHCSIFQKENFVEYYKTHKMSLEELPRHNRIFLLDQLSGSGTKAIRLNDKWEGKIPTFREIWKDYLNEDIVYYTPYIISSVSKQNLKTKIPQYLKDTPGFKVKLNPTCHISTSPCLASSTGKRVDESRPVSKLCVKYYDRFVEDPHIKKGGSAVYGYGGAGLTLIIQSNCPNNTIPMVWHDYKDWYPLFPRVAHHR